MNYHSYWCESRDRCIPSWSR